MLLLLRLVLAGFIATALGLGATWYSVRHVKSLTSVAIGSWRAHPANAKPTADPYARANMAFAGTVPLGQGEGIVLDARRDSHGRPLTGACTYLLTGEIPAARFWTLTATMATGTVMASLTSGEAVWLRHHPLAVAISRQAQPGNWLALTQPSRFSINLRLYDTGASFVGQSTAPTMPTLTRESCP